MRVKSNCMPVYHLDLALSFCAAFGLCLVYHWMVIFFCNVGTVKIFQL